MRTIIDKGPQDPGPAPELPEGEHTSPEHEHWKAKHREHAEWHKAGGEPREVQMHDVDAQHAVSTDPDRYEIDDVSDAERRAQIRSRMTLEARVAALEDAMDAIHAEDEPEPEEPGPEEPEHD